MISSSSPFSLEFSSAFSSSSDILPSSRNPPFIHHRRHSTASTTSGSKRLRRSVIVNPHLQLIFKSRMTRYHWTLFLAELMNKEWQIIHMRYVEVSDARYCAPSPFNWVKCIIPNPWRNCPIPLFGWCRWSWTGCIVVWLHWDGMYTSTSQFINGYLDGFVQVWCVNGVGYLYGWEDCQDYMNIALCTRFHGWWQVRI